MSNMLVLTRRPALCKDGSTFPFESLRDREEKRWKETLLPNWSAGEPTLQVDLSNR